MRVLITAGPTREALDPVRYLSNRSSGKMGYALAAAFAEAGHQVLLISGPTSLDVPDGVDLVPIEAADEMFGAVEHHIGRMDTAVFAAAVADYRPASISAQKIKKHGDTLTLELIKNPDILGSARSKFGFAGVLVGFAAETENLEANARDKLQRKGCDLIIANDVSKPGIGFDSDRNRVLLVHPDHSEQLPEDEKHHLAPRIVREIELLAAKHWVLDCGGNAPKGQRHCFASHPSTPLPKQKSRPTPQPPSQPEIPASNPRPSLLSAVEFPSGVLSPRIQHDLAERIRISSSDDGVTNDSKFTPAHPFFFKSRRSPTFSDFLYGISMVTVATSQITLVLDKETAWLVFSLALWPIFAWTQIVDVRKRIRADLKIGMNSIKFEGSHCASDLITLSSVRRAEATPYFIRIKHDGGILPFRRTMLLSHAYFAPEDWNKIQDLTLARLQKAGIPVHRLTA